MASGIYLNESSPLVGYNKKKNRRVVPTLEKMQPDHAITSSVAITKLPLGREILKKKNNNKKEKCNFLKIIFLWTILTFWLSYIVHTASLLAQEHSK